MKPDTKTPWILRDDHGWGPFLIRKINEDTIEVERLPSRQRVVLEPGDDPHYAIKARNSLDLATKGSLVALVAGSGYHTWHLVVKGTDVSRYDAGPFGTAYKPLGPFYEGKVAETLEFRNTHQPAETGFVHMAKFAKKQFGVNAWARDRFGDWVPADDWRAVAAGVPCASDKGTCDRVAVEDGLCKTHLNAKNKIEQNNAERKERAEAYNKAAEHKRRRKEQCEAAIEEMTPILTELGIHPDTVTVGTVGEKVGVLLPAEAALRLARAVSVGDAMESGTL